MPASASFLGCAAGRRKADHSVPIRFGSLADHSERRSAARACAQVCRAAYTTATMVRMEREIVSRMQEGNFALDKRPAINEAKDRAELLNRHPQMNEAQHKAAEQILPARRRLSVWTALLVQRRRVSYSSDARQRVFALPGIPTRGYIQSAVCPKCVENHDSSTWHAELGRPAEAHRTHATQDRPGPALPSMWHDNQVHRRCRPKYNPISI